MNPKPFALSLLTILFIGVVLIPNVGDAQVIFEDDLSDGANWSVVPDADTNVAFGFDYSESGIPPAPNGDDTLGMYAIVNFSEPAEVAEMAAVYFNDQLTGQFTVTVDVWNNWHLHEDDNPTFSGTTEFSGLGVGHTGEFPGREGASFVYDGDGDSSLDYRLYKDDVFQEIDTGQYGVEPHEVEGVRRDLDNANPEFVAAFPGFDVNDVVPSQGLKGVQRDGAGGFQWMTLTAEVDTDAIGVGTTQDPGLATFRIRSDRSGNEVTIGTIDNSNGVGSPVFMDGSVALIMSDLFTSVSPSILHSFAVFDNVKIVRGIGGGPTADVDFDGNGVVDTADVDALVQAIVAGTNEPVYDLTGDDAVDDADLAKWLDDAATENGFAAAYFSGDANLDGIVDAADLNVVGINWQDNVMGWSFGDFTADGIVNAADLNDLGVSWQQSTPIAAAVPEPSSLCLIASLLVGFSLARVIPIGRNKLA